MAPRPWRVPRPLAGAGALRHSLQQARPQQRTPLRGAAGFSLVELLLALVLGLALSGMVLQTLVAEGGQSERLVRLMRERLQQRRVFDLLRTDLRRAEALQLQAGDGAACPLAGRRAVLGIWDGVRMVTYSVGAAPSPIWRGQVLMRCGPAFGLHGEVSEGASLNRVVLDGLVGDGLVARLEAPGLLRLELRQEFQASGGRPQRIASALAAAVPP